MNRALAFLLRPSDNQLAAGNTAFLAVCLALMPFGGSAASAVIYLSMGWGFLLVLSGHLRWPPPGGSRLPALAFAAFFIAELIAAVASGFAGTGLAEVAENLQWLGLLPLLALMRIPRDRLLALIPEAATLGAFAAFAVALILAAGISMHWIKPWIGFSLGRVELLAGNAMVIGRIACVQFGLIVAALVLGLPARRGLLIAGALAAAGIVVMSGTRTYWIAMPIQLGIVLAIAAIARGVTLKAISALAGAGLAIVVILALSSDMVRARYNAAIADISRSSKGNFDNSFGQRLTVWKLAVELIPEKPILGHGPGVVPDLILNRADWHDGKPHGFTHFHNGMLDETVRAGIIGAAALLFVLLAAPLAAWRNRRSVNGMQGLAMILALYLPYWLALPVAQVFGQDLTDSLFIAMTMLALYAADEEDRSEAA